MPRKADPMKKNIGTPGKKRNPSERASKPTPDKGGAEAKASAPLPRTPGQAGGGRSGIPFPVLLTVWLMTAILLGGLIYWASTDAPPARKNTVPEGAIPIPSGDAVPPKAAERPHSEPRLANKSPRTREGATKRAPTTTPGIPIIEPPPPFSVRDIPNDSGTSPNRSAHVVTPALPSPEFRPTPAQPRASARIAIIIDDFGQDSAMAKRFLALPVPITFSILPHQRHSAEILRLVRENHREAMLHMPMEPDEYPKIDPGRGALLVSMSEDAVKKSMNEALDSLPSVSGINNHMGSRFTQNEKGMRVVLSELNRHGLFFIDSETDPGSIAWPLAVKLHVPALRRDIFLDHDRDEKSVRARVDQLIRTAKSRGEALAIGHPYEVTLRVLRQSAARFADEGTTVVSAGELVSSGGKRTPDR